MHYKYYITYLLTYLLTNGTMAQWPVGYWETCIDLHILTIVGIFLVAGFGEDVVLDTLFAEGVHALEALGVAEVFEADLTDQELVVQFLRQTDAVLAVRHHPEVFLLIAAAAAAAVRVLGVGRRG